MMTTNVQIREVSLDDLQAIHDIYSHYVRASVASLQLEIQPYEESKHKYEALIAGEQPFIVAVIDQQIVGFAYSSDFNERLGYQHIFENSLNLHPNHVGKGLGRALVQAIIDGLETLGKKVVVAKMSILPGQVPEDKSFLPTAFGSWISGGWENVECWLEAGHFG